MIRQGDSVNIDSIVHRNWPCFYYENDDLAILKVDSNLFKNGLDGVTK